MLAYGKSKSKSVHRHDYEFNNSYLEQLEKQGMIASGKTQNCLVEIIELERSSMFVGVQFHPEYKKYRIKPSALVVEVHPAQFDNKVN